MQARSAGATAGHLARLIVPGLLVAGVWFTATFLFLILAYIDPYAPRPLGVILWTFGVPVGIGLITLLLNRWAMSSWPRTLAVLAYAICLALLSVPAMASLTGFGYYR